MWTNKLLFYLLCLASTCYMVNSQIIAGLVVQTIVAGIRFAYQEYETNIAHENQSNPLSEVTAEIHYLSLKNSIEELKLKIEKLMSDEADVVSMKIRMYDLQIKIGEIDRRYEEYLDIKRNQSEYHESTLKNFYEQIMNDNSGIPDIMYYIHENIVGLNSGSLVDITAKYIEYFNPYCQRVESRQRYFFYFFISVVSHEIKGLNLMEYAYKLKQEMNNITLVPEIKNMREHYNKRIFKSIETFKSVMARVESDMWKCDPDKPDNHTYVELKNLFRRIFYNAIDFTDHSETFTCRTYDCPKFDAHRKIESKCKTRDCNLHQRHCSDVVNCQRLDYDDAYEVCVSNNQDHGRRYDYVHKYDFDWNAATKDKHCNGIFRNVKTEAGGAWAGDCNACNCICNEPEDSDRYISLKPVVSDVKSNNVITGVQFVLKDHTLHIKIQESKLLQYAFISNSTVKWKDVEVVSDGLFSNDFKSQEDLKREAIGSLFYLFEGKETFKIDWYKRRGLYLDDLKLNKNETVTGVRFLVRENKQGDAYIGLDIQATPFNYSSGELFVNKSYWLSSLNTEFKRDDLQLGKYDSPTSLDVKNILDNIPHQVTEFTPSAYLSKDAGQTTLPLIDIQPVAMTPAAPLSGISLDIKRAHNSGGYLILKTTPYNVLWHMDEE